jgi:hypothetical protein
MRFANAKVEFEFELNFRVGKPHAGMAQVSRQKEERAARDR